MHNGYLKMLMQAFSGHFETKLKLKKTSYLKENSEKKLQNRQLELSWDGAKQNENSIIRGKLQGKGTPQNSILSSYTLKNQKILAHFWNFLKNLWKTWKVKQNLQKKTSSQNSENNS